MRALLALLLLLAGPVGAEEMAEPLDGLKGDAARGRAIVASRQQSMCLLCHSGPIPEERFQGTLAPSLAGAGTRWSAGALRFRLAKGQLESIMPAYYSTQGLNQVGREWQGKTIFTAQQLEDVVAYLVTLR